jgi:hypothetical protein
MGDGRILKQRSADQNACALLAENVYMLMIVPLYVVSGFGVGLLVGMTGVGGGSLMTPLLILLFGVHPATAVGTDLLYAAATKSGGSVAHGWARTIHWPAVTRLACGSIPASIVTLVVLWQLDLNGESSRSLVNLVLCFALLLTAASLVFRKAIMERYRPPHVDRCWCGAQTPKADGLRRSRGSREKGCYSQRKQAGSQRKESKVFLASRLAEFRHRPITGSDWKLSLHLAPIRRTNRNADLPVCKEIGTLPN